MTPILTVTLNPALDLSTQVDAVRPADKLRCTPPVIDPGGGGVNVARAIGYLGGKATAWVALGGATGEQMATLLRDQGIDLLVFEAPGETRQSLAVTDAQTGLQYRFVLPGPEWHVEHSTRAQLSIGHVLKTGGIAVLSGSLPPGLDPVFPQMLAKMATARDTRLIVDTSGAALTAVADCKLGPGHVLRLDRAESSLLARRRLTTVPVLAQFAADCVARDMAGTVVLSLGAEGSVLANAEGVWHAVSPLVSVISTVGAGDSFVAGFSLALVKGLPEPEALRRGVAAASAAVMTEATRLCSLADVNALLPKVTLTRLRDTL